MKENRKRKNIIRNAVCYIMTVCYFIFLNNTRVRASGIGESIYVKGTLSLFADLRTALQLICAAVFIALILLFELKKRASEEQEQTRYKKLQLGAIIGLIISETIVTFLGTIGSYYGVTVS